MANYCTFAQVIAEAPGSSLASTDTSTDFEAAVDSIIPSASRAIDEEVGGWPDMFSPTTDDTTRYFDGSGEVEQDIDFLISLTSVSVAEEGGTSSTDYTAWTLDTDFYVWPYSYDQISQPIQRLVIDFNGNQLSWGTYRKSVQVTGVFGWSATPPADIVRACIIQSVRWYMRAKQYYQQLAAGATVGTLNITPGLDADIRELLIPYQVRSMR